MTQLVRVPLHQCLGGLARDPLGGLGRLTRAHDGDVLRLNLGAVRPFLVTHPRHVHHVLRERPDLYRREGMLWKPLQRLEGDGIAGDGAGWQRSRRLLQPVFTARSIARLLGPMAAAINEAVGELAADRPLDVTAEMTRVVHRSLIRAFFGDRISLAEAERLGTAISTAFASLGWRIMLPFAPGWIRLPGDGAFHRSVRRIDEIIVPHVRLARERGDGPDLLSMLASARDEDGRQLSERAVRDDVVSMFVAGTETTALALTWGLLLLDAHPGAAARVRAEVDRLAGPPGPADLDALGYTGQVLQETLRLYPVGWVVPRTLAEPDTLDGVRLPKGATVLVSPYLTHRLPSQWPEPDAFDPDRFGAGRLCDPHERRPRFAYFPFGGGVHQCLGSHFFTVEAQLIVAALLHRFHVEPAGSWRAAGGVPEAKAAATLRPRAAVSMTLRPTRRGAPLG